MTKLAVFLTCFLVQPFVQKPLFPKYYALQETPTHFLKQCHFQCLEKLKDYILACFQANNIHS